MSVNKSRPHALLLPEDDANRQIAVGFEKSVHSNVRQLQVLPNAGGWRKALDALRQNLLPDMARHTTRYVILLLDFDKDERRQEEVKKIVPPEYADRVFLLGAWSEPEELRTALGDYETIGENVAKACREGTDEFWKHELLKHNRPELDRMALILRPIFFPETG